MRKKILIACDHRGTALLTQINNWCKEKGYETEPMGPDGSGSVDYPDFAIPLAERVAKSDGNDIGVLICGWGNGMAIAANKVKGIRAGLCLSRVQAEYARSHNDANILVLSAEATGWGLIEEILKGFLETEFAGERHKRRVAKITNFETKGIIEE